MFAEMRQDVEKLKAMDQEEANMNAEEGGEEEA